MIHTAALYFCHVCEEERPEYQFIEENLVAIQAGHAETQSRLCVHGYMRARADLDEKKMYPCTACNETKHLRDFSPAGQKEWIQNGYATTVDFRSAKGGAKGRATRR